MNKIILTTVTTMLMSAASFAQAEACIDIEEDLDRLACYDKESGRTPVTTTETTESAWVVNIDKSEMTDEETVTLIVLAEEPIQCGFIGGENYPALLIRCKENTTAIFISTDCHLSSSAYSSYGDVTYRLDDREAVTKGFDVSSNNNALGLWNGGKSIPFIKGMLGHESMLTRFMPYSENAVTARFPISGLEEAIEPLRNACSW